MMASLLHQLQGGVHMTAKLHKKYLCCAGHRGTGSVLEPIHVVKSWDHRIVEKKHYRKRCVMGDKTLEYLFFVFVLFFQNFPMFLLKLQKMKTLNLAHPLSLDTLYR